MIETRTEIVVTCPAELTAELPARVPTPAGATIEAAKAVLDWIAARFAREDLLEQRIRDGRAACAAEGAR
ncbi:MULTISPECIES: hypothetical protein [unclassified Sphingomonas]|uniref:hypothetical protein n=1 Tax=unclassified Sphingomonas TaxID=196159 RepID=UPI000833A041|nr:MULTISPECIES: hypothetical protein [unclassified Sphingomonas]